MISSDYTWSESDSYVDNAGHVFVGYVSERDSITLKLDIKHVKSSFQMQGDSLRVHYLCPTIDRHYGEVVEHQFEPSIKGKPIAIDKWQLLKIKDVRAINQWLESDAVDKIMEKYL